MEKEFHIYLGEFCEKERKIPFLLYILAEKKSEYDIDFATSIMKKENFGNGDFHKIGKKSFDEMYDNEEYKDYFELAIKFGYCIVKYS